MRSYITWGNVLALWMLALMCACGSGGGGAEPAESGDSTAGPGAGAAGAGFNLPSPQQVLDDPSSREASGTVVMSRAGSGFFYNYNCNVEKEFPCCRFKPNWAKDYQAIWAAAYAVYNFRLADLSQAQDLNLLWDSPPKDYGDLWLGFSNWDRGRWDWRRGEDVVKLSPQELARFSHSDTRDMYVAVVLLGTSDTTLLRQLYFISGLAESPWPMAGHDPRHTHLSPYAATETGTLKWRGFPVDQSWFGYVKLALGADGLIYCTADYFLSVVTSDAKFVWGYGLPSHNPSYPAVSESGVVYLTQGDTLFALAAPGRKLWERSVHWQLTAPAITGGNICVCSEGGKVYAYRPDGNLRWDFLAGGELRGTPVGADDGTLYFGSDDGKLYALRQDGSLRWSFATGGPVRSMPFIAADGTVYCGSDDGKLYVLAADGTLIWSYQAGGKLDSYVLVVADGTVYAGCNDGYNYALSPAGELRWKYSTSNARTFRPVVDKDGTIFLGGYNADLEAVNSDGTLAHWFQADFWLECYPLLLPDGTVYIGCCDGMLYALDTDLELKWGRFLKPAVRASPTIAQDGHILCASDRYKVAGFDNNGACWRLHDSYACGTRSAYAVAADSTLYYTDDIKDGKLTLYGVNSERGWRCNLDCAEYSSPVIAADGSAYVGTESGLAAVGYLGAFLWESKLAGPVNSSPALSGNMLYVGAQDGALYAVGIGGDVAWRCQTGGAVFSSPAVDVDGTVYFGSMDGKIYATQPDGAVKWAYLTGAPVRSSPGIGADGAVYCGSDDGKLYVLEPDGRLRCAYATGGAVFSSPAIDAKGAAYFGSLDGSVYAVDASGALLWSYATEAPVYSSPAIGADGSVYIGSDDGYLYAFGD